MLLWLCFALLTAAVVGLLLQPLRRAPATVMEPAAADLAVYRDQLRELDAERDRGLIIESEIENARAEVARRLIKRAEAEAESGPGAATTAAAETLAARARNAYAAVAVMIPLVGIALYLLTGSPHLSAHPFAERRTAEAGQSSVIELISRVEERLREHPEDGKGWDVIAPIYLRLGRFADSAHAFAEANRLEGESVRRLLGFAEATLLAGNGIVTEPVRRAALRVLELEPARKEVRVWLVLAKEQDGDLAGAAADYREILETAPADAPWRSAVSERLALITKKLGGDAPAEAPAGTPPAAPPGSATAPSAAAGAPAAPPQAAPPDAPDIAAMSPAEREAFIQGMVDRLATRLKDNGRDLPGWIRLANAYKVLGREDDARGAMASARANFASDQAALQEIERSEQSLGLAAKEQVNPQ